MFYLYVLGLLQNDISGTFTPIWYIGWTPTLLAKDLNKVWYPYWLVVLTITGDYFHQGFPYIFPSLSSTRLADIIPLCEHLQTLDPSEEMPLAACRATCIAVTVWAHRDYGLAEALGLMLHLDEVVWLYLIGWVQTHIGICVSTHHFFQLYLHLHDDMCIHTCWDICDICTYFFTM